MRFKLCVFAYKATNILAPS